MELFNYYSLDECFDLKSIKKKLTILEEDGKISYSIIDGNVLKITDLDLDENEISALTESFDNNDIFPYPDYDDGGGIDPEDYDDFYDEDFEK